MLEVELKSNELKEYVYIELNKRKGEPIYDAELEKITELDLDKLDLVEDLTDLTLEDIIFFKNLKSCYIGNFILDDKSVRLLNTRKSLEYIQLNDCVFMNKNIKLDIPVNKLVIVDSKNVNFGMIEAGEQLENIRLVNCENVTVDGISHFKNLKKVYFQNLVLQNINELASIPNLAYVNLNGSVIEDDTFEKKAECVVVHEKINAMYDFEE